MEKIGKMESLQEIIAEMENGDHRQGQRRLSIVSVDEIRRVTSL